MALHAPTMDMTTIASGDFDHLKHGMAWVRGWITSKTGLLCVTALPSTTASYPHSSQQSPPLNTRTQPATPPPPLVEENFCRL